LTGSTMYDSSASAQGEEVRVMEPLPDLIACVRAVVQLAHGRIGSAAAAAGSPADASSMELDQACFQV